MSDTLKTAKKRRLIPAVKPSTLLLFACVIVITASFQLANRMDMSSREVHAQAPTPPGQPVSSAVTAADMIERKGEGRLFYTTIKIPAGAETLYLSGSGARPMEDGSCGDMEYQAVNTFTRFKETLAAEGWSMSDIVQVRAFATADEFGVLDFAGFNRGYMQFFGTEENPMKPVRSFVQVADLVNDCWLVEIEIRAARVP
ncbi:MAG: Rid family hydrolase [Gammaproteobacteria bacterium]|nr:hypothetical protein [Pseudomonadales bacterium]MCP5348191.1 hypothetical protein [Pseudomonadales bacterium]